MKRAAIIITDANRITGQGHEDESWRAVSWFFERTSEQLLADLRTLVEFAELDGIRKATGDAAARVRALLPKEGEDG